VKKECIYTIKVNLNSTLAFYLYSVHNTKHRIREPFCYMYISITIVITRDIYSQLYKHLTMLECM